MQRVEIPRSDYCCRKTKEVEFLAPIFTSDYEPTCLSGKESFYKL